MKVDDETLTAMQLKILTMTAEGMSMKLISASIGISIKTVEGHKYKIYNKLKAKNAPHSVMIAMREGILR